MIRCYALPGTVALMAGAFASLVTAALLLRLAEIVWETAREWEEAPRPRALDEAALVAEEAWRTAWTTD